jgi:hypothetical protein
VHQFDAALARDEDHYLVTVFGAQSEVARFEADFKELNSNEFFRIASR